MTNIRLLVAGVILGLSAISGSPDSFGQGGVPEASKVRVLLVLDTLDKMGATWGLDGKNVRALLEHSFDKQGLQGRYTIDEFTGKQAEPDYILNYYRNLNTNPTEALVFYYSGHGGFHLNQGHYLAMKLGKLYRKDLLAAMASKNSGLRILLTDCCANIAGGAYHQEPPGGQVLARPTGNQPKVPRVTRVEPVAQVKIRPKAEYRELPRPDLTQVKVVFTAARKEEPIFALKQNPPGSPPKNPPARQEEPPAEEKQTRQGVPASTEEPPFEIKENTPGSPPSSPPARQEEPAFQLSTRVPQGIARGPRLKTLTGMMPMEELLQKSNGEVIRQLFFQQKGLVDINGCPRGDLSNGLLQWGGSLFTIGVMQVQSQGKNQLDKNANGFIEWGEFYPAVRDYTLELSRATLRRGESQTPTAFQLQVGK